jgi:hypothetical protein
MAGDWIKMNSNLWDNPKVAAICDELDEGEAPVIGALFRVWSIADQHSEDGVLIGMTEKTIDRKTGVQGFADALRTVGWLIVDEKGISIPDWEQHHSQSAKKRAVDAQRKAKSRAGGTNKEKPQPVESKSPAQAVLNLSEECPTESGQTSELEKNREEESNSTSPVPPRRKSARTPSAQQLIDAIPSDFPETHRDSAIAWAEDKQSRAVAKHRFQSLNAWLTGLKRMAKYHAHDLADAVEQAIASGWQGWEHESTRATLNASNTQPGAKGTITQFERSEEWGEEQISL